MPRLRYLLVLAILFGSIESPAATTLEGKVIGITDGDTITLLVGRTRHTIRLAQIDAPESGQPWGSRSRQALADKVFNANVRVVVIDVDSNGREVGTVWLGDRDINRELVREGDAWVYQHYLTDQSLLTDERTARAGRAGLWDLADPVAPWDWRHARKTNFSQFDAAPIAAASSRAPSSTDPSPVPFQCGSKVYCREMASCAEAMFYLNKCGLSRLDGDSDGVPCETICGH
jgi:endonuclease YncB( thermonuclease family)